MQMMLCRCATGSSRSQQLVEKVTASSCTNALSKNLITLHSTQSQRGLERRGRGHLEEERIDIYFLHLVMIAIFLKFRNSRPISILSLRLESGLEMTERRQRICRCESRQLTIAGNKKSRQERNNCRNEERVVNVINGFIISILGILGHYALRKYNYHN